VVVEDCSTSWSNDDGSTISSLDKVDDDVSSNANDDANLCTLNGDRSCPDDIATISSSTTSHCFMSQGDTEVQNAKVLIMLIRTMSL
jgi:hypothetical protein